MGVSQDFREVKFSDMDNMMSVSNDTLYAINFWATWCKPCVEELPYFEEAKIQYSDKKFRIILVSLDFQHEVDTKFKDFLLDRNLQNEVWYLNERKFNKFIPEIDQNWSGALPFTLFFRGKDNLRKGKEGAFKDGELNKILNELLN